MCFPFSFQCCHSLINLKPTFDENAVPEWVFPREPSLWKQAFCQFPLIFFSASFEIIHWANENIASKEKQTAQRKTLQIFFSFLWVYGHDVRLFFVLVCQSLLHSNIFKLFFPWLYLNIRFAISQFHVNVFAFYSGDRVFDVCIKRLIKIDKQRWRAGKYVLFEISILLQDAKMRSMYIPLLFLLFFV